MIAEHVDQLLKKKNLEMRRKKIFENEREARTENGDPNRDLRELKRFD